MAHVCLRCGTRMPDSYLDVCPGDEEFFCGAKEWVWVEEPKKPLTFSKTDRVFLKVNRIASE